CRLHRYVIQELAGTFVGRGQNVESGRASGSAWNPLLWLTNPHGATLFSVMLAAVVAALPAPGAAWSWETAGQGGLILWPLFGATNQLLAGLSFLVISFFLWRRNVPVWFVVLPMLFMLTMPAWAMSQQLSLWLNPQPLADGTLPPKNWVVIVVGAATLALEVWMVIEALLLWPRVKGVLEERLPPLERAPAVAAAGAHTNR
ncbi:MAG: hypothetical protein KF861_06270, partial [Planctomycetaceae bacterium]|nr:hypothetical protein [Planctomycetaceae bacterium]